MTKRVVVIASGETERRCLPHLLAHLQAEGISVVEIRRPDGNKPLTVEMGEKLVKAAWYAPSGNVTPDKFVILVDTAVISEGIAKKLNAHTIVQHSASFRDFLVAIRNGNLAIAARGAE